MQIGDVGRDQSALGIVPGSGSDAGARIDGRLVALLQECNYRQKNIGHSHMAAPANVRRAYV